jgi:hypothetical protein
MASWFEKAKGHMWQSPKGSGAWTAKLSESRWGSFRGLGKSPIPRPVPAAAAKISSAVAKGSSRLKWGRALTIGGAAAAAALGVAAGGIAAMTSVNPYINRRRKSNGVPMQSIGPGYPTFSGGHGPMSSNNLGTAGLSQALYNTRRKQH